MSKSASAISPLSGADSDSPLRHDAIPSEVALSNLKKSSEEVKQLTTIDDGNEMKPPSSIFSREYYRYRVANSALLKFKSGEGIDADTADTAVGTFTLVNALLLTIPFSLVGSLGNSYWDWLQELFETCPHSAALGNNTFEGIYVGVFNQLVGTFYACISCLLLASFYYLLRPKAEKDFRLWWPRGRWVFGMLLIGTILSVVICLTLAGTLVTGFWYFTPTSYRCDDHSPQNYLYAQGLSMGLLFIVFPSIVAILLMA